jgi:hypothetical protein
METYFVGVKMKKIARNEAATATLARVKKQMEIPRKAESVKIPLTKLTKPPKAEA